MKFPCSDCIRINGKWYCDMNCGPAVCPKCKSNISDGEECTCPKEIPDALGKRKIR